MFFKRKENGNKNSDEDTKNKEIVLNTSRKKKFFTKKNIIIVLIVLLFLVIISIVLFRLILKDNVKFSDKEDDRYPIFTDIIQHNDAKVSDYINGYYVVHNDNYGYALMDKVGNLKTEYTYLYFQKLGDLIGGTTNNGVVLFDKDMNIVIEAEYINDYACNKDNFVLQKNGSSLLINNNGEVLLENYDNITCQDNYIIASKNEKEDVYDKNLAPILKGVDVNDSYDYDYISYSVNDNFIVLKEEEGKSVYFTADKKKSKNYSYVAISNDYVAVTDNEKVILKDKNDKIITKFNKNYENYGIVNKDLLYVPNDSCHADGPEENYADLYNSKGDKKTPDGCNYISVTENDIIIKDSENNFTVYSDGKKIFEKNNSKALYISKNSFGNYDYGEENSSYVLNNDGKRKSKECKNLYQIGNQLYDCSPTYEINYVYNEDGKIIDSLYKNVSYYLDNFVVVKNTNNKYGLYDKNGNKILDEKYDNITITDSVIILEYNGKTYSSLIKYGNSKEYKEFLKKDKDVKTDEAGNDINYDSVNVSEIVNKYNLQSKSELINENELLFKKVAYHVVNNNKLTDNDKKNLLGMFEAMVDFDKYNKIEKLLNKIDKLEIKVFNKRPSEMTSWAAGNYFDSTTSIYVLKDNYDYAIEHEIMHMISYSASADEDISVYECGAKVKNYEDIINMSLKEQSTCETRYFDNNNMLLEEAGAEYFTTVVYEDELYQTYNTNIITYVLLQYILEDNFVELQYSPSKVNFLYKLLNEKIDYNYEKAFSLINAIADVSRIENYNVETNAEKAYIIYHMADELIDLYMAKNIGDWKNNEYLCSGIYTLINSYSKTYLDRYLSNNPDKNIKYYNDLTNLNYSSYISEKVREVNQNIYSISSYYIHDESNKIVINVKASSDPYKFTLELYYDEKGKLIDKKVIVSDEPLG